MTDSFGRFTGRAGWPRDPMAQFLIIGALLFAADWWFGENESSLRRIEFGTTEVEQLAEISRRQWQRDPDEKQLRTMIEARIREEILYREALARGLDRDDVVVRRRLAQKMEFLAQQDVAAPTDAELQAYLREHRDLYRDPAVVDLEQMYFGEGSQARDRAASALARMGAGQPVSGVASLLPRTQQGVERRQLVQQYGDAFADAIQTMPDGEWLGPVESVMGIHLVRVAGRRHPAPDFDSLRERLQNDLGRERVEAAREAAYAELRAQYEVRVDGRVQPVVATQ